MNSGTCGKSDANIRPIPCPSRVVKLLRINSGLCSDISPCSCMNTVITMYHVRGRILHTGISGGSFILESLKVAVGPSGKCTIIIESKEY